MYIYIYLGPTTGFGFTPGKLLTLFYPKLRGSPARKLPWNFFCETPSVDSTVRFFQRSRSKLGLKVLCVPK